MAITRNSPRDVLIRRLPGGVRDRARATAAMIERLMKDYAQLCVAAANQGIPRPEPDEGLIADVLAIAIMGRRLGGDGEW